MVVLGLASQRLHNSGSSRTDSTLAAAEPIGGRPESPAPIHRHARQTLRHLVQLVIDYTWLC